MTAMEPRKRVRQLNPGDVWTNGSESRLFFAIGLQYSPPDRELDVRALATPIMPAEACVQSVHLDDIMFRQRFREW